MRGREIEGDLRIGAREIIESRAISHRLAMLGAEWM
jgi:hypothetical protein